MRRRWAILVVAGLWLIAGDAGFTQSRDAGAPQARPATNPLNGDKQAIRNGGAMYRTRCAGCHGPDAKGYVGPDLTGLWASGFSDGRIFDTIRHGVPGTEMPAADPERVADREIWQILAYVRTLAASSPPPPITGNAENGARVFQTTCSACHMVNGAGGHLGPDLSRIGSGRSRAVLMKKLRGPNDNIRPGYEPVTVVMRDGQRIRGVKKNEDEFSIQIMDLRQRIQGFPKANLSEVTEEKQSVMPIYGPDQLSDSDLQDLLRFLATLRGPDPGRR
jgi:cytochrome c oxidase cbb3-type subunit III